MTLFTWVELGQKIIYFSDGEGGRGRGGREGKKEKKCCQPLCLRQLKTNLGATICIGPEIRCLTYAGFFRNYFSKSLIFHKSLQPL